MTTPWWLIMLGGLLGSSHCVGMCGGFALMLGMHRTSLWSNLQGQLLYSGGRLATYSVLGGIAGFAGRTLSERVSGFMNIPAMLSLVAGLFLVWEGLHATGLLARRNHGGSTAGCLMGPLFSSLLKYPGLRNAFCAGVFTGLLPCGLVYAFVSLAAATGDLLNGSAVMVSFGAGTVPLMVLTGTGGVLLSVSQRQRLWRLAAWSVVVTGLLTVTRGVAFLQAGESSPPPRCPLCAPSDSSPTNSLSDDLLKLARKVIP
ncbi:MAG TPA: sulfite exporter TauE/SafE family protein [Planctomycetaceae bacterium]|nr:sulfite exporter TauE/SafE family protein [Planctomycetaceae bacterium]